MKLCRYLADGAWRWGAVTDVGVVDLVSAARRTAEAYHWGAWVDDHVDAATATACGLLASVPVLDPVYADAVEGARHGRLGDDLVVGDPASLLLGPVDPAPSKVLALGYNYHALCRSEGVTPGAEPNVFAKMPTSVIGPRDPVRVPAAVTALDYEAELGVVIGTCARDLAPGTGMSAVAGWTVVNDVTAKILPRPKSEAETVVFPLKGRDAFAPVGDVLVTTGEVADPADLELVTRVNGEERQRFSPADMVHDVASVVEYLSGLVTLEPGDLIATGTSVGIGIIQDPPALLADGDVVECELTGYSGTCNEIAWDEEARHG